MRTSFRSVAFLVAAAWLLALSPARAAERVALLIGNNQYPATPLRNAVNDARDLAEALKELGFKVIVRENATRKDMYDAIREFGQALEGARTALFFYAGHAMQFRDRNFLIPIDAVMGTEDDVTFFSVEISQVLDRIDRARTRHNFVILDACRDNPFASSFKITSSGLAQMSAPSGTLIAYATSPGAVAADGFGRNGIYTKHILQHIRTPDLPVELMFKRVREGVELDTKRQQTPWDSSSLKGDFAFNITSSRPAAAAGGSSSASADVALTLEREFWVTVRESNRPEDIQAYLDKYPNGTFAPLARNRLSTLSRPARPPAQVALSRSDPGPGSQQSAAAVPGDSKVAPPPRDPAPDRTAAPPPEAATARPESAVDRPAVVAVAPPTAPAPASGAASASMPSTAGSAPAPAAKPEPLPGREIAPGIRELTFDDGSVYRGAVRGPNPHGRGEYISKAFRYEGEYRDGLKQGQGTYTWENGNRYEGPFVDDRPSGIGKYTFPNGDVYVGDVVAGVITGRGTYTAKNGDVFEGSFLDGKLHGVGIFRFTTGDRYEGEVAEGRPQGKGRYFTKGGDRIEAPFVDGRPQGKGTYQFANGDRYEGDIRGSELTGTGAYFYASGLKYEGEMRRGQPEGKGTFWFHDGSRFEGSFENGLARARGEIVRPDGARSPAEIVKGEARVLN